MEKIQDKLEATLSQNNQLNLLKFLKNLPESPQKSKLAQQLEEVDWKLIQNLKSELLEGNAEKPLQLEPLKADVLSEMGEEQIERYRKKGNELLSQGKVACFLVAGGQGSRLGHEGPKGSFDIGLKSHKSLFELQAQRLKKRQIETSEIIPWYVMTSPQNHLQTTEFFESNNYFGLNPDNIMFFPQGTLPAVDTNGELMLSENGELALSPNGNGGCFKALKDSGALSDMKNRGVEYVFFYAVDNALVNMADPVFIGYTYYSKMPTASKVVAKANPEEKVGLLVLNNGRPGVMEYSDMPEELLQQKDSRGNLLYNNGNIAIHLFSLEFLLENSEIPLPFHKAHKKIPTLDNSGKPYTPSEPNGYKFEMFMFDLFPRAKGMAALQIIREEEFAPVKNKEGVDSPESARSLLTNFYERTRREELI